MTHKLSIAWSKRALSDLDKIAKFIEADQPAAANMLVQAIRAKTKLLEITPHLGREILPGLRELIVHRHYLVVYRIRNDNVQVLQVWHTARKR